jgi:hypothetical protein
VIRVEFDSTLDELVDVNIRLAEHTVAFRRQRIWSQVFMGGALAVAMIVTVFLRAPLRLVTGVAVVGAAVAFGVLLGFLYGHFYDGYVRRHYRRMLKEMSRGAETIRCEFELRPDVLWCKTTAAEMSFSRSRLTRINDTEDSVELWFDPGLAVVRNRAFLRPDDRREFIDAVTKLSRQGAV